MASRVALLEPFASSPTCYYKKFICFVMLLYVASSVVNFAISNKANADVRITKVFPGENAQRATVSVVNTLEIEEGTTDCDIISRSTLYSKKCDNRGSGTPRRLLVTGVGRSGTDFLANILRKSGLRVSHDNYNFPGDASDGAVAWPYAFNDKICKHPYWTFRRRLSEKREHDKRFFQHVLHLVRDPLKTIESRWNMGHITWFHGTASCNTAVPPADRQVGEENLSDIEVSLARALQHWVLWNTFIETITDWRIKTEDVNGSVIHKIYDHTSINPPDGSPAVLPFGEIKSATEIDEILAAGKSDKNHNHTKHPPQPLTWNKLMDVNANYTIMALLMAQRYGYDVDLSLVPTGAKQVCGIRREDNVWACRVVYVT